MWLEDHVDYASVAPVEWGADSCGRTWRCWTCMFENPVIGIVLFGGSTHGTLSNGWPLIVSCLVNCSFAFGPPSAGGLVYFGGGSLSAGTGVETAVVETGWVRVSGLVAIDGGTIVFPGLCGSGR